MRRRFGRRRRNGGGSDEGRSPLDAAQVLERIATSEALGLRGLAAETVDGVPPGMAVVARGEDESGAPVLVAFAPRDAGDALLAALAAASPPEGGEPFAGTVLALSPSWSVPARRRLALLGDTPFPLRAQEAPELGDVDDAVLPEPQAELAGLTRAQLAAPLLDAAERLLAERAMEGLAGLGAKHGGVTRAHGRALELVLLARRVAAVRIDDDGVLLDTIQPQRRSERLSAEGLGEALDRLEGGLRKRLQDREVRDGEDGLRTRAIPALVSLLGLRSTSAWPRGGADGEVVDVVGVDPEGRPVIAAIRERLGLPALGAVLDALVALRPALPALLADALPPLRFDAPRLVLATRSVDAAVARVLRCLSLSTTFVELRHTPGRDLELVLGEAVRSAGPVARRGDERRGRDRAEEGRGRDRGDDGRGRRDGRGREDRVREPREGDDFEREARPQEARDRDERSREGRARDERPREARERDERPREGRGRDERGRGGRARPAVEPAGAPGGFEEVSLFDLDVADDRETDEAAPEEAGVGGRRRRRRRGRGRGRSRREGGDNGGEARDSFDGGDGEERAPRAAAPVRPVAAERDADEGDASLDDEADLGDEIVALAPDAPEFVEEPEVPYEEDEEGEEEGDPEGDRLRRERELRRRARVAKAAPKVEPEAPAPRPQRPRRVAVLAHADRDSVAAAVVLARDLRLLEGIWIYPQSELMTFFRGVATDLREDTPIHVIGFAASPARDVIQAAALYRDRLVWYDHHSWPPEDVEGLRAAIGADAVHVTPGARSSLPAVLSQCGRRSRFSDKLVDLVCARFTQHDYERWGRLWWTRLGTVAARTGERRADLEALLAGRPSDLAREAAAAQRPALPDEVEFVAGRDFRVVHFGGHALVVVPVPAPLDLHLAARIARDRYGAAMSLAFPEGEDLVVLAADEQPGRRPLDVVGMAEHLAGKHDWAEALSDADHVARIGVRRLALHPERIDELLAEIAMGRSILEG